MKLFVFPAVFTVVVLGTLTMASAGPRPNDDQDGGPEGKPCKKAGLMIEWEMPDTVKPWACLPSQNFDSCGNPIWPAYRTSGYELRFRYECRKDAGHKRELRWIRFCAIERFRTDDCSSESRRCYCDSKEMPPSEYPVVINKGWSKWKVFTPSSESLDCWGKFPSDEDEAERSVQSAIDDLMGKVLALDKKGYRGDFAYQIQKSKTLTEEQKFLLMEEIAKKSIGVIVPSCEPKPTSSSSPVLLKK